MDDDDLSRRGIAELLGDRSELKVVDSFTHVQAMDRPRWDDIDVVMVDAADERLGGDQFPGVEVVETIRLHGGSRAKVHVVTGHFFDDAIRRRMREAGADFFHNRLDLHDTSVLYGAVLDAGDVTRTGVPAESDPETTFRLGVTEATRVNRAVRYAEGHPVQEDVGGGGGRRSRAKLHYRLRFARETGLNPVNADGRPPDREQDAPSLPQIQRFLEWATKVKDRRH